MISKMSEILVNPFASKVKMYSITYDSLVQYLKTYEQWVLVQNKLLKIDKISKLLDIKKLPDYSMLEAA